MNQPRVPVGVTTGGQFATGSRAEADVALTGTAPHADEALHAALARYALVVDDVPADHEGVTITEHWHRLRELAAADPVESSTATMNRLLGDPDYGRHRGGPDAVWWDAARASDPDAELDPANDPADPRWDDPDAVLAAEVHTRNGGGNRECWCDSDEHHCLVQTIETLQGHPAYLADHDEETYADFYLTLHDKAAIRDALGRDADARLQAHATARLAAVESGAAAPWTVMPVNPASSEDASSARDELKAMGHSDMGRRTADALGVPTSFRGAGYGSPSYHVVHVTPEHLQDVDAVLEWAPPTRAARSRRRPRRGRAPLPGGTSPCTDRSWSRRPRGRARRARPATRSPPGRCPRTSQPSSPQPWTRELGDYVRADEDLERETAQVAGGIERLGELRPALVEATEKAARRARLSALTSPNDAVLRWPGDPETMPAPPAPSVPRGPWSMF